MFSDPGQLLVSYLPFEAVMVGVGKKQHIFAGAAAKLDSITRYELLCLAAHAKLAGDCIKAYVHFD